MIFSKDFPRKSEMSIDDMVECVDRAAVKALTTTAVTTLVIDCGGL